MTMTKAQFEAYLTKLQKAQTQQRQRTGHNIKLQPPTPDEVRQLIKIIITDSNYFEIVRPGNEPLWSIRVALFGDGDDISAALAAEREALRRAAEEAAAVTEAEAILKEGQEATDD